MKQNKYYCPEWISSRIYKTTKEIRAVISNEKDKEFIELDGNAAKHWDIVLDHEDEFDSEKISSILKKPVIFIPGIDYNWGDPSIINEKGCLISSINELKNDLKGVLNNTKLYAEQQNSSRKYLSKLISHHGNASDEFYKYLKNYTI